MTSIGLPKSLLKSLVQSRTIQFRGGNETITSRPTRRKAIMRVREAGGYLIGDGIEIKTVAMAYVAIETIRPSMVSNKCPVILMHEMMDSKSHWTEFGKQFHNGTMRKVFAVDARNHGDTLHSRDMTYLHIAEDIKTFMESLNIEKCSIVGHGMGGRAAMTLALKYPNLVERLVVIDASPMSSSVNHIHMGRYLEAIGRVNVDRHITLAAARKIINFQLAKEIPEKVMRFILTENLVLADDAGERFFKWRINVLSIASNLGVLLKFPAIRGKIVCDRPALFIHGEIVEHLEANECMEIRRLFPKSDFVNIATAGHWVHAQNPRDFLACVVKFINNTK